ncbi:related to WD40-repeat protein (notchless protein) [Serendipita indica DSM 11827]|uniref:Related to WD40-repeat protein (Notchless protein) n=1 Tax=Serendipita indica (strain DSM 11827) TaxID=1109443 RepID=G4TZY9_SERID|nr:related to WD40-repeat protein (notchless protein) [Serendipita indica DSM 11827]
MFSPDGLRIVSGSNDQTVRLWDAETGNQVLPPLRGHTNWVSVVAFSPDGHYIASGSYDCTVMVWDAMTGEQFVPPLEGHRALVCSISFSPDSTHLVSGSGDCTIRLWSLNTGVQIGQPLKGHTDWVRSVAFSPDGRYIVSGSNDKTVRVWNVAYLNEPLTNGLPSCSCSIDDRGWLSTPWGDPLFWIPPQFRTGFERPGVRIIGQCERLTVDTSRFVHGLEWTRVAECGPLLDDA